jgi:hypothetical protein
MRRKHSADVNWHDVQQVAHQLIQSRCVPSVGQSLNPAQAMPKSRIDVLGCDPDVRGTQQRGGQLQRRLPFAAMYCVSTPQHRAYCFLEGRPQRERKNTGGSGAATLVGSARNEDRKSSRRCAHIEVNQACEPSGNFRYSHSQFYCARPRYGLNLRQAPARLTI